MHLIRMLLTLVILLGLSLSSVGQDAETPEDEVPLPPPPETRPLDEIFIPSEEIAADEEVTFPVNI
ncbi:MAG: hypothetical protein ACJ0S4_10275 [Candidatus Rariloculaceae bacterium]